MAYTTIDKSSLHFNTKLYTGTGSELAVTGVGFKPDWTWIKSRSATYDHTLYDVVRGATKQLYSNQTNGQYTEAQGLKSFDSDGFTNGTDAKGNNNGSTYVSWNWLAGGSQGSSNTDGSINTTYTSVNTTAGFSICQWEGTGANATIGHGLGVVPKMYIVKNVDATNDWNVYHHSIGNTHRLFLNTTQAAEDNASAWNDTSPTSSVFSVSTNTNVNQSGSTMIAYVFAEKTGFSKFGSYTGNGNADGTFIYTGFKPALIIIKKDATDSWFMYDNKRGDINPNAKGLTAESNAVEETSGKEIDFVSNGVKIRNSNNSINTSGSTYIYMAFAEAPLVGSNNIPATAR
jgi:hypothetical protein